MTDYTTINESLEVTAEKLGDFTPNVFEVFYTRFPEARDYFKKENDPGLEGDMLTEVVYCFFQHLESPGSAKVSIMEMVPHHQFLGIPSEHFIGLFESVVEVVTSVAPDERRELWVECWNNVLSEVTSIAKESAEDPGKFKALSLKNESLCRRV